jgi:hypothetical protein
MDSGFFSGDIFDRLEEKHLPYIVATEVDNNNVEAMMTSTLLFRSFSLVLDEITARPQRDYGSLATRLRLVFLYILYL